MNATAGVSTGASTQPRGRLRGSPPGGLADEVALLDRLIDEFGDTHASAVGELEAAVVTFRKALARGDERARLLKLALEVNFTLLAVRRIEAALRRLGDDRAALLARPRA